MKFYLSARQTIRPSPRRRTLWPQALRRGGAPVLHGGFNRQQKHTTCSAGFQPANAANQHPALQTTVSLSESARFLPRG
jgi:hypothetical protein